MDKALTPGEHRDPIHLLTIGYVLALIIIAIMTFCIHLVIDEVVKEQTSSSIVLSAKQAQLTQHIALYATQYVKDKDPVQKEMMKDAVKMMKTAHEDLVNGDNTLKIAQAMSSDLSRIYFSLPYNLDRRVLEFIEQAEALIDDPSGALDGNNEHYQYILETAKGPLLSALEAALLTYESESELRVAKLQSYQKIALFIIFATLIAEAILIFKPLVTRVRNYAARLKELALTDALTGVDNSRSFNQKGVKELRSSHRHGKPLSICMMDLDRFKSINDRYGHQVGDIVLQTFAEIVHRTMRVEDEFARIGGEEFAVLLPHTDLDAAIVTADRIRRIVEATPVRLDRNKEITITVSIGVAEVDPRAPNLDNAMHAADKALYRAKKAGRNQVVASESYKSENKVVSIERGTGKPNK